MRYDLQLPERTRQVRVAGQSLYTKDPNCGCIDPATEVALNPAACADQAPGAWGVSQTYYGDFRVQRRPSESLSIGNRFPIWKEGMSFRVRAEFFNAFNRLVSLPSPVTQNINPATAPTRQNGVLTGGFGYVGFNQISSNKQNNTYPSPLNGADRGTVRVLSPRSSESKRGRLQSLPLLLCWYVAANR